eukprot:scaffold365786_cov34-Prasinocladus_malaysianus.AAC.2
MAFILCRKSPMTNAICYSLERLGMRGRSLGRAARVPHFPSSERLPVPHQTLHQFGAAQESAQCEGAAAAIPLIGTHAYYPGPLVY